MSRFLGTVSTRLGAVSGGFTKAKVFSTPGSTTWQVPSSANKLKVFVIGAGSDYNAMSFCNQSNNCNSGVTSLGCCYCMNYIGHAMGAGGGYAEKTLSTNLNGTATIVVGSKAASIGDAPTNSVFSLNGQTITGTSATQINAAWSCTDGTTARDSTYDMETSLGFAVPVCGYQNCITGYWQVPGTGTGGDVNRTGGAGVVIPEFRYDSAIFPSSAPSYGSGGGGSWNVYSCNRVLSTFGFTCYCCCFTINPGGSSGSAAVCGITPKAGTILFPGTAEQRPVLQTAGSTCGPLNQGTAQSGGGSLNCTVIECSASSYSFYYGGRGCWCMCAMYGGSAGGSSNATITYDPSFRKYSSKPTGLGATSGTSEKNGQKAKPEAFTVTPIFDGVPSSGGSGSTLCFTPCSYNGNSVGDCQCWLNARICNCNFCPQLCFFVGGGGSLTPPPYYDITYIQTETSLAELSGSVLQLNNLTDENGNNLANIKYGAGAGNIAATYGGGGNRTQPAGNGLVVVMY